MNPKSSKPRKQRKFAYDRVLHQLHRGMAVHLSRELRKQLGMRALPVKKGDTVAVLSGKATGKSGKVTAVEYASSRVAIEKVLRKKSDGKEIPIWIAVSNLVLIELDAKDPRRLAKGAKKEGAAAKEKATKPKTAKETASADDDSKTKHKEPKAAKAQVKSK